MQHILAINSSVASEGSASRLLVEETVERLHDVSPAAAVTWRDLGASPVPRTDAPRRSQAYGASRQPTAEFATARAFG